MNKRIIYLLLAILLITLWTMFLPYAQRVELTENHSSSIPNFSPLGYQGLYQLIESVHGQPVGHWRHSMMLLPTDSPKTIWIVDPGERLFAEEDYIAQRMRTLVQSGYHVVFILNSNSLHSISPSETMTNQMDFLNAWYNLHLVIGVHPLYEEEFIPTESQFLQRNILNLRFQSPMTRYKGWFQGREYENPALLYFSGMGGPEEIKPLLIMRSGAQQPLALEMTYGKGSVTLFPNAFLFQNAQLNQADNAAMAVALEELHPNEPILFEEYSNGFTDNKDFLTYLGAGKGVAFLLSVIFLFFVFCVWIANRPIAKKRLPFGNVSQYFSQETFLSAMGDHYLSTRQWDRLYQKLLEQFDEVVSSRHAYLDPHERLQIIAQSPFYDVSLEQLEAIYQVTPIATEAAFIEKSRLLLEVLRKVRRHEFRQSKLHRIDPPLSNRS